MIEYEERTFVVPRYLQCNKCKKKYDLYTNDLEEDMEAHEFVNIEYVGGYNSIFGDETKVRLNLCQHCFKELCGEYVELEEGE